MTGRYPDGEKLEEELDLVNGYHHVSTYPLTHSPTLSSTCPLTHSLTHLPAFFLALPNAPVLPSTLEATQGQILSQWYPDGEKLEEELDLVDRDHHVRAYRRRHLAPASVNE